MGHKNRWTRAWKHSDKRAEERRWQAEIAAELDEERHVEDINDLARSLRRAVEAQDWEGLLLLLNAQSHEDLVQLTGNLLYTIAYKKGLVTERRWHGPWN